MKARPNYACSINMMYPLLQLISPMYLLDQKSRLMFLVYYFIRKNNNPSRKNMSSCCMSTLANVGPFFKFTIVKLNVTIINDLN